MCDHNLRSLFHEARNLLGKSVVLQGLGKTDEKTIQCA